MGVRVVERPVVWHANKKTCFVLGAPVDCGKSLHFQRDRNIYIYGEIQACCRIHSSRLCLVRMSLKVGMVQVGEIVSSSWVLEGESASFARTREEMTKNVTNSFNKIEFNFHLEGPHSANSHGEPYFPSCCYCCCTHTNESWEGRKEARLQRRRG